MVVQHDHAFVTGFDLRLVLDFMSANGSHYTNIPQNTTFKHLNKCFSSYKVDVRAKQLRWGGSSFIPMMFWCVE
jgi:hypothetical protein